MGAIEVALFPLANGFDARRRAAARMDADLGELDRAYIGRHGANRCYMATLQF